MPPLPCRHFRLQAAAAGLKAVPFAATAWETVPAAGLQERGLVSRAFNVSHVRTLARYEEQK